MKTKIGITSYDNDHELWETHIGSEDMELRFSAWGKTEQESKSRASLLRMMFTQYLPDSETIVTNRNSIVTKD